MAESRDAAPSGFPVVGIGASAGGLEAFKKLLPAIPKVTGMAFVVIQHMSAEHESLLPEILQKVTDIPVLTVEDEINLEPDHIYVMPSAKLLTVVDGKLKIENRDEKNKSIKIIDLFFSSLGVVHQSFAVGVVLSGTASDGTLGLKTIKAYGGITFAQDQSSAFNGMPQSAIRSGDVDFILPPEDIPAKLIEINTPFHQVSQGIDMQAEMLVHDEAVLKEMLSLIRVKKNVDFNHYKKKTITRRIVRRMALSNIADIQDYLEMLKKNGTELDLLYNDFLISVTQFFRDPKTFSVLREKVLPSILKNKKPDRQLRIWIAGCATGQEAYSVAICVHEVLSNNFPQIRAQIFATDVSESAIAGARNGIYDKTEMEQLTAAQIDQYFTRRDGQYQVVKEIRDMCVFAYHNMLQDPPFARIDLVSCRNVLIYMEPILQKRAFSTFHYALNENGFLMLGKSESAGTNPSFKLFDTFEAEVKMFIKKGVSMPLMHVTSRRAEQGLQNENRKETKTPVPNFQKSADDLVLSKYAPPGVVINDQFDIVQFRGSTGRWLEPSPGRASLNLLKMAKEGLSFELRNILHKAKQTNAPALKKDVDFVSNDQHETVTIEAITLPGEEPHYLILFHSSRLAESHPANLSAIVKTDAGEALSVGELKIGQLERELALAREDMRSITEEQEASNEELQSANEELLSTTEELQTLNEELQTSNEEVQSTNEELQTLNQELLDRNNQLNLTNKYVEAIIDTIKDPIIILDRELRVRTASKGFYQRFGGLDKDTEGFLFYELKNFPWVNKILIEKLQQISAGNNTLSQFELICELPGHDKQIFSINANELQRIAGEKLILVFLEDVTTSVGERNFLLTNKHHLEERIKMAIEATGIGTWDFDPLAKTAIYDDQCKILFGFKPGNVFNYNNFLNCLDPEDLKQREEVLSRALSGENNGKYETIFRIRLYDKNEIRWIQSRGKVFFDGNANPVRLVGTMLDITEEKINEQLLKESEERFRLASEASTALIWMSGTDKQLNYFNKSWLKFTGRMLEQEIGSGWTVGIYPEDFDRYTKIYNDAFDRKEEFYMEFRLRRHDGEYRWTSDSGAPRFSPAGSFEGYIGTCLDIHDQKMGQEYMEHLVQERTNSLQAAVDQLAESNQNLSEFAYVASHDLQEPLRKINTFSQQLKERTYGDQSPEINLYLNKITDASRRMSRLIEDLLNYARVQNAEDAKTATDLTKVIERVVSDFDLEISQAGAIVEVGDMPVVHAIPLRMNQLFHNLMSNSLKFTAPGQKPYISVRSSILTEQEKKNLPSLRQDISYHQILFSDNGIGFNPEFAERIFTIFHRLNGRSQYEGTGIGLAICRKIVLTHHGIILANSEENKGSQFRIILPVMEPKIKT